MISELWAETNAMSGNFSQPCSQTNFQLNFVDSFYKSWLLIKSFVTAESKPKVKETILAETSF